MQQMPSGQPIPQTAVPAPPAKNLFGAVEASDPYTVRLLLRMGTSPDMTDEVGRTPLFVAAMIGYHGSVQILLEHNANPNVQTQSGMTPLMAAAMKNHLLIAEMLIDAGANPDQADSEGLTPLAMAVQEGHAEMIDLLVSMGADPDRPDQSGTPPLIYAIQNFQSRMVQALIRAGVDVQARDPNGDAAVHWAVRKGDLMSLNALIDARVSPDDPGGQAGDTPLMMAVYQGSPHMVQVLLDRGANPEILNQDGWTALMLLCAEPEADEFDGERAPRPGMVECMTAMLSAQPDLNAVDPEGFTPLMLAASRNNVEFVNLLLAHGADKNLKNNRKQTAQMVAKAHGHKELAKALAPDNPIAVLVNKLTRRG